MWVCMGFFNILYIPGNPVTFLGSPQRQLFLPFLTMLPEIAIWPCAAEILSVTGVTAKCNGIYRKQRIFFMSLKILLELELNTSGKVTGVRVVEGRARPKQKPRRLITEPSDKDSEEIRLVREFVAEHGVMNASRLLNVSHTAIYQWTYRGVVPEKYVDAIGAINTAGDL